MNLSYIGQYIAANKDLGIQCTQKEILETQESKWLELFQKHKKKDDLADCFLQGMWYINMKLRTT